jgi:hypothetical protein
MPICRGVLKGLWPVTALLAGSTVVEQAYGDAPLPFSVSPFVGYRAPNKAALFARSGDGAPRSFRAVFSQERPTRSDTSNSTGWHCPQSWRSLQCASAGVA